MEYLNMKLEELLLKGWGIKDQIVKTEVGLNKSTWKVGNLYWLSSYPKEALNRLVNECHLYTLLEEFFENDGIELSIPSTIKTLDNKQYYSEGDFLFRVSKHVNGIKPDVKDQGLYQVLAEGLGKLHLALKRVPVTSISSPISIVEDTKKNLILFRNSPKDMFNSYNEYHLLKSVGLIIEKHITQMTSLEVQAIHGDFSHPNLCVNQNSLVGVLDFEFYGVDPPIMDLATIGLTLILRSDHLKHDEILLIMIKTYNEITGSRIDLQLLVAAMFMRKYDSYCYHKDQYLSGNGSSDVLKRQINQLNTLLKKYNKSSL